MRDSVVRPMPDWRWSSGSVSPESWIVLKSAHIHRVIHDAISHESFPMSDERTTGLSRAETAWLIKTYIAEGQLADGR